jgi:hypothetical protein
VPGSPLRFEASLNGRVIGPTSKRGLVHAFLAGQERLLLVLGDEVIELWRSQDWRGGGNTVVAHHWKLEHLSAGEGSAAVGEPEEGDGRVVPIVEGLRGVLAIDGAGETNLEGPKQRPRHTLLALFVVLALPALLVCPPPARTGTTRGRFATSRPSPGFERDVAPAGVANRHLHETVRVPLGTSLTECRPGAWACPPGPPTYIDADRSATVEPWGGRPSRRLGLRARGCS